MGEFEVGETPFSTEITCPICEGNKCSVCDMGPPLNDIINCIHYDLKGEKYRKRICAVSYTHLTLPTKRIV